MGKGKFDQLFSGESHMILYDAFFGTSHPVRERGVEQ